MNKYKILLKNIFKDFLWFFSIFILVSHDIFAFIYVLKILWYYQENNIPNIYRDILSQYFYNISDFFDNAGLVCVISLCCDVMECHFAWEEWFWSFFDIRSGAVDFLSDIFQVDGLKNNCSELKRNDIIPCAENI